MYLAVPDNPYIHHCRIPAELSSNLTENHHYIQLDLAYSNGTLLKNIKVRRLHPLDRRHFTTTSYILTNTLTDNMLIEWITYNLMLGVEHFYIFDNRKLFPPLPSSNISTDAAYWELSENSAIVPFLDANLISLVYFPIHTHRDSWVVIQEIAFSIVMEQFGKYVKYMSYNDADEFFLPSAQYQRMFHTMDKPSPTFFTQLLTTFDNVNSTQRFKDDTGQPIFGFIFDNLDMGCEDTDPIESHPVENAINPRKRAPHLKTAATTHCTKEGILFAHFGEVNGTYVDPGTYCKSLGLPSFYAGRGKTIHKVGLIARPHSHFIRHPWLGTQYNGGVFCHYTNFRLKL